ncbi:acyl-CoA dehydrogenase family protein [Corynebacterium guangdongense]|uniref:Glutaryl-CoA dehydrogenase n=1 Tax=Corynebacterium guangdongense TaxID=1783348 RepID=A0ABU1ZTY4_9CORY|nr:acyl-CoA dehydrogenase family protein [Corynebacterium guangdongense]MDR7328386.1 glutaryl-CoA dehydrogenase [Corynebacterium guangdongense]WJZ16963.1 Acyl-CoA dehydrogenase [Corynebacterium guangdongense]
MTTDWKDATEQYLDELRADLTVAQDTDFYLLESTLPEEAREIRTRVRGFVDKHVLPVINEYWERAEFPYELLEPLAKLGVVGSFIEGYGCPGLSRLAQGMITQEMSRGDGSVNTFLGVQANLSMGTIYLLGSEEQKQRWLPAMARLEQIGCFALTEPRHGSDSVDLQTSARREGDTWVINGAKRWIGNGSMAHNVIIFARDEADGQVKAFVMEREDPRDPESRPEGFSYEVITAKAGKRAILQANLYFQDLRIDEANRLPGCDSFRDVSRVLASTRGGASWESLGHAIACFEAAAAYAGSREQFGRPIGGTQLVQNTLAKMATDLTSIQLMCHRMAQLQEEGSWSGTMASIAKMHTADRAREVARQARDLLGGNGLLLDFHVMRHLTDMEVVHTYEGTEFIQSLLIGRKITSLNAMTS